MNKNSVKWFYFGSKKKIFWLNFHTEENRLGIHILKLVCPSECHLLDFVKTNISPNVISVTLVACVLFYWSVGNTGLELKEKCRNIPDMYLYTIVHYLMKSFYLLAIHRANLFITKRVSSASRWCLFAQMSICIHSLRS